MTTQAEHHGRVQKEVQRTRTGGDLTRLMLDGTKNAWHLDRVRAWERGERIAPITVDMALTRGCDIACVFCYAVMEESESRRPITVAVMERFLADAASVDVKGVSLVGDGESTLSPAWEFSLLRGHELGIAMASGTNGYRVTPDVAERVLPALTYLRFNFEAATPAAYARIMGTDEDHYQLALCNVRAAMEIKRRRGLPVTIGLQMVLMPQYGEEILPLARLAVELGVNYLQIKHCADDEFGSLGVDYAGYRRWYGELQEAEALSTADTRIMVKWQKIEAGNIRSYARCYGAPFILEMSGAGLVVPCGMLTNQRYAKFHIGNIVDDSFAEIVRGDRYWEVMSYLASPKFDARRMCGVLCLQDATNRWLDERKKGLRALEDPIEPLPLHGEFL